MSKMEKLAAQNPGLMEYAHHVGSFKIEKLNEDEMKNNAMLAMHEQTQMQLDQIYEQVELLAKQAQRIKERSDISRRIYHAKIAFKPIPGSSYFLYKKKDGEEILSMIAPDAWGREPVHAFIAAVKMLADHTWSTDHNYESYL
ncbi:MAG: DUF2452 domain-containing protein [Oligoflexales bacterium]|nr:DUF2452 domain-containing protein [Oligoflexales bacterium]